MGLDQYAFATDNGTTCEGEPQYVWRKHAKLQEWAEQLFEAKTGNSAEELNCGYLELSGDDIESLKQLVEKKGLPDSPGGFFYGHQFQEESASDYRAQDLEFCNWALVQIAEGQSVYYSCWW